MICLGHTHALDSVSAQRDEAQLPGVGTVRCCLCCVSDEEIRLVVNSYEHAVDASAVGDGKRVWARDEIDG